MAPGGGGKRKRGDRTFSHDGRDDTSRPSPHRPGNLSLGQQSQAQQTPIPPQSISSRDQYDPRGGGRRRGSRAGRGSGSQRSPLNSPNGIPVQSRSGNGPLTKITSPPRIPAQPSEPPQVINPPPNSNLNNASTQAPGSTTTLPSSYLYEQITDERISSWAQLGKTAVIDTGIQACKAKDMLALTLLFQELIRSCLDGRIDGSEAGATVKEILEQSTTLNGFSDSLVDHSSVDASSLFLDCLSVIADTYSLPTQSPLQPLVLATGISPLIMRSRLDSTLLESLAMIRSTFVRVGIRQQTNLIYRQSNYNLLREETEGYSKLITELFTTSSSEPLTSEVVEETFERVKGMIGAFDLDVGRVLDVTLDVFAAVLVKQYRFFVKYLRASSWWPQQKTSDGASTDLGLGTLPKWALPGSSGRPVGENEKDELAKARDERDTRFWTRVGEIGMGAFFEIGGRRAEKVALEETMTNGDTPNSSQLDEDRKWIEATGTLPPSGNKVAAQVLGFKLRFYSSSARDPTDILPLNLIYLAALLIKIGFISLRDLYPHLWPADEAMEEVRQEKMKEKEEKEKLNRPGGGTLNALMTAPALIDDTPVGRLRETERLRELEAERLRELEAARNNTSKAEGAAERGTPVVQTEEKEELPSPADQKVQLLKSLLCIGAIPESLYMLGRFPWLPDAIPDLPEHIHRILHHCLSKVYEPLRPLQDRVGLREQQRIVDPDQSGVAKGQLRLINAPPRKGLRWAQLDKEDMNEATDFRFYWDDWADSVPVCQSVDDVFLLCSTLVNYTGVKIGQDIALLLKLSRIGSHSLATDPSEANTLRWIDLSKRLIVPSLSLTKCNPGVVNEVFELIKIFPTTVRYSIYAEWYTGQISRLPDIKTAFAQAKAETKDVLKRISKTNVKPMARALAKVAYASPGIVFEVAIAQIESYDNLVETVVECARYFTYLGYDVLSWSLMNALGGRGRTRVQADGMLTSRWLAALSLFAGKVFKRYSVMSATPILQYVAEQLRQGNTTDLIVLREITISMAGIVSDTDFNESQVQSMAGGDVLQTQTKLQILDRRHESRTTARRLIKSLTDPGLAGQILVSIAQERQKCIFMVPEPDAHLKLLGNLFDELHRILVQYLDLLRSNLAVNDFDAFVPSIPQLITEYGIEPCVAFWIGRPSLSAAMREHDLKTHKRNSDLKKSPIKEVPNDPFANLGDDILDGEVAIQEKIDITVTTQANIPVQFLKETPNENLDLEMKDVDIAAATSIPFPAIKDDSVNKPWHPVLREVMDAVRPALPEQTWEILSPSFYITFWQLSLPDMQVPTGNYKEENERLKKKVLSISADRTDISILGSQKKEKEKKALNEVIERLTAEVKEQIHYYTQTRGRLQREKDHWFSDLWGKWDAMNIALIENCFFPRILLSPVDAMYVFKMLKYLHSSGATNFRTIGVFDQLFKEKRLTSMLFLCTAKEAENFGRFLNEVLKELSRWHADKSTFEKEAYGLKKDLPGFSRKMTNEKTNITFYDYEEFRRVLLKWHRCLNSAIKACISSGEYMHIRNAINILKATCQYFPAVNWMGQGQVSSVTELSKSESRVDLKIAATSLLGNLKRREKDWVLPQAFSLVSTEMSQVSENASHTPKNESSSNGANGVRATSTKPSTPQPEVDAPKTLNPKAADFLPNPRTSVNGVSPLAKGDPGKLEFEDGEIEDARLSLSVTKPTSPPVAARSPTPAPHEEPLVVPESVSPAPLAKKPDLPLQDSIIHTVSQVPYLPEPPPSLQAVQVPVQETITKVMPTGAANNSLVIARPELNRAASANGRVQHSLPSRPESLPPRASDHRVTERPGDRGPRDVARDSRFPPDRGRSERPGDSSRDRVSDYNVPGPYTRGYDQGSDRAHISDRTRTEPGWGDEKLLPARPGLDERHGASRRDAGPQSRGERIERPPRDRSLNEPQHHLSRADFPGQPIREAPMAPPRSNIPQHPERAALIQGSQDQHQTLNSHHSDRRPDAPRYENFSDFERSSRAASPTRTDDRRPLRRDDRPPVDGRRPNDDGTHAHSSRYGESHFPTGPRTDHTVGSGPLGSNDRFRDAMKVESATIQAVDDSIGRLSQDPNSHGRQRESQYGRLNPAAEIPSGPRLSNGNHPPSSVRGTRIVSAPQPQIISKPQPQPQPQSASHVVPPSSPVVDKQAPTGPASVRGGLRSSAPFSRSDLTSSAVPASAGETPDTASVHPDRLKAIQGHAVTAPVGVPQIQGNTIRVASQPLSAVSIPTPVGPRGPGTQLPSPVGPSPTSRGPPTGPSYSGDRNRGDKRFAGIQNMLQQSSAPNGPERSSQGASIRGRGGRANHVNIPSPSASGPSTPSITRQEPYPPRADLFAGRTGAPSTQPYVEEDLAYGRGRRAGRDAPREGERRSERHRNNRSRSRDNLPGPLMPPRDEERLPRREDLRERPRGGPPPPSERDLRRPAGREDPGRGRRPEPDRREKDDWTNPPRRGSELDRREERERRDGGGGSGRKRGRAGEDGLGERVHSDNKRSRRMN